MQIKHINLQIFSKYSKLNILKVENILVIENYFININIIKENENKNHVL